MKTLLPSIFFMIFCHSALAKSFGDACPDIPTCANFVGDLLDQKYVFDQDVKGGKLTSPSNLEIDKNNAEILFTNMLQISGYSRVPTGHQGTFTIMRGRDARDSAIPLVTGDKSTPPNLPQNWDMYTLKYKATSGDITEHIARESRTFMPAYSRIVPDSVGGYILVTDSAMNLKKLYSIIVDLDVPMTFDMIKKFEAKRDTHNSLKQPPQSKGLAKPQSTPVKTK